MKTTLIVVHPNINQSRINSALAKNVESLSNVNVRYLYDLYPDGKIDVNAEQAELESTDRIVLQFPMQWYSTPPLLKQWLDDVLTFGWSHGGEKQALLNKKLMLAVSLGGPESAYQLDGAAGHTVGEYLLSFETIAQYLGMQYIKPFITGGSVTITDQEIAVQAESYKAVLA
ncbi:NAD(P)H-dependent oxidoreductase [Acinetobacter pittii]|jgi:putative NADPH-quinone reductase|uniref:NAD(P)H-dependent oxidoreductase n=1 Tax=Acinetobacter pittii TaxID=48296 RepID=UPI0021D15C7A|nr:NAD(P)H-dependent oxidoreductase [Acinetobacter pittii]MCU4328803.1 NAD(P)H-dependent oxidoreductase [Acinetobacter pittii]